MKIRTINNLQDAIDSEMAWRKKELSALKSNIQSSRSFAKETALRAGIALLYAHWEGAIKNIAYYYLVYVSFQKVPYNKLKNNFLAVTLKQKLLQFEETNKTTLQTAIINSIFEISNEPSQIPTEKIISTNSNLNSAIFNEIMCTIGLKTDYYEQSYKMIDEVLLNMRNNIAHGERLENIDLDEKRYNEIHDIIFDLINHFSVQVLNAACLNIYLAENEEPSI
ncbi:MAE_28990/MAE_18760 family HEPN-like nuclease [Porcipelethomonas ammoniilytica]|uniref:MAE_28990/MAE_18760 family HEPN-like nuclease n=1 Tax=Porcipelethomonas ammoniilytica TaxID=2981722 RepID=UPI0008225D0B|nr:MAE_28990/MAE_18760 family HEPN-like nuclease [Porcipelethomonas ammoniilytica]MCU6720229.1 MAE_28990/MAE_18760 family HEPN-like nuclease [Porcipelethomonas ammoniilytica]SCJ06098.1 Uncharacterised protein [uncultured Ruminococcus sp.]